MRELLKNNKAITLIALIITIIILLILSGVTIAQLTERGLFDKVKQAKEKSEISSALEEVNIAIMQSQMNENGNIVEYEEVWTSLRKKDSNLEVVENIEENSYEIIYKGYKFKINKNNNNVIYVEKAKSEIDEPDVDETNLIAWYDGIQNTQEGHDGETTTWVDLTGNNTNGAAINGATWTKEGLLFDGSNDWVNMNSILMPEEDNFTIDVVVSLNKYTSDTFIFGQAPSTATDSKYRIGMCYYNTTQFGIFTGMESSTNTYDEYNPKLTEKVNLVMVRNGDILELWANGEKILEKEVTNLKTYQENTILGRWGNSDNYYLDGIIYSVKAYDKDLTEEEIKQNYSKNSEKYKINNYGDESALGYVSNELTAWYDGFNNTGENHDYETTTWTDLTGNNTTGATISGATWTPNGLLFDGDDVVNTNSILMLQEDNFTIDIVFSMNTLSGQQYILSQHNSASTYRIGLLHDPTNGIGLFSGMGSFYIGKILKLTEKTNLSFVRNGDLLQIWVNGNKEAEKEITNLKTYQTNTILGKWGSSYSYYLKGIIYSVRAYNRILTEAEIQQNYKVDKLRFDM